MTQPPAWYSKPPSWARGNNSLLLKTIRHIAEFVAVTLALLIGGGYLYDEVWLAWRGHPPWAFCAALGLVPLSAVEALGLFLVVVGMLAFVLGRRQLSIGLIIVGALAGSPTLWMPQALTDRCPWIMTGSSPGE